MVEKPTPEETEPKTKIQAIPGLSEALARVTAAFEENTRATRELCGKFDVLSASLASTREAHEARFDQIERRLGLLEDGAAVVT